LAGASGWGRTRKGSCHRYKGFLLFFAHSFYVLPHFSSLAFFFHVFLISLFSFVSPACSILLSL
jgi:hypothetical protein